MALWRAGAQEQAWTLAVDSAGYTVFRNAGTSTWKAIGISASSTANGAKAIQWSYVSPLKDQEWIPGGGAEQRWVLYVWS